jgi:Sulfotransferase family
MNFQINFELVNVQEISGWAFSPDCPEVHLGIELKNGSEMIGYCEAGNYREDLAIAGIGRGDHGFSINFDPVLGIEQMKEMTCRVVTPNAEELALIKVPYEFDEEELAEMSAKPKYLPKPKRLSQFSLPPSDGTQRPVFVLGAARSGTSAMAQALLKSGEFEGFNEGHCLWMLSKFLETIHGFYEFNGVDSQPDRFTMLAHVPYTYMTSAVRAIFVSATAEMFAGKRWIDKTPKPEMIEAAVLMKELWPNARFLFMKRRAIENVVSRLKKFPTLSFEQLCSDWAKSMEAWLVVRDLLGSSCIELDQRTLAQSPKEVSMALSRFLGMSEEGCSRFTRALCEDFPERTSDLDAPCMSIQSVDWPQGTIKTFRKICGPMMGAFGYGYGAEYFSGVASINVA